MEANTFFTSLDPLGGCDKEIDKICRTDFKNRMDNHQVFGLIKDIVKVETETAGTNVKFIDNSGSITSVPCLFMDLCDSLASAINAEYVDLSDVYITLPGSKKTVECLKELLICGQTSALSKKERGEVRTLLSDVGLKWNITVNKLARDDTRLDYLELSSGETDSSSKESSDDENNRLEEFWDFSIESQQVRSAKLCRASCLNDCQAVFGAWDKEDQVAIKSMFTGQTKLASKKNLMSHLITQGNLGIQTDSYIVKGHYFCMKALHHVTGISEYILKLVIRDYLRGIRQYEHGNKEIFKQPSVATISFIGWFKQFLEHYGQSSPDEELTVLPYWLKGKVLYNIYVKEVPKPRVALRTFYCHLDTYFGPNRIDKTLPRCRISKYSSHSVCDTCEALRTKRKECVSEAELSMVNGLINQHQLDYSSARQAIEGIKNTAMNFANDNLYIQLGKFK